MGRETVDDRFFEKVHMTDGCWTWKAATTYGYGVFWAPPSLRRAHRYAYEQMVGPVPEGLELDHLCRNRACVRPDHLEPVTRRVNQLRGFSVSGLNARKTHCVHGHEYTPENTVLRKTGKRCRACQAAQRPAQIRRYTEARRGRRQMAQQNQAEQGGRSG